MENTIKKPHEKQNNFKTVLIETLVDNPNNPNSMSKSGFAKLVRNIERTGLYEPIIVRRIKTQNTERSAHYEIINGHHRLKALKMLGHKTVDVCVWDVDDMQSDILLATLNNLRGSPVLEKKLSLLHKLSEHSDAKKLSELLPLTSGQIERYQNLSLPCTPAKQKLNCDEPLIFFVNRKQKEIITNAIRRMQKAGKKSSAQVTKTEAITHLAEFFNKNCIPKPDNCM